MNRDRKDFLWIAAGALLAAMFALVAYDQLYNLHFSAWRLYTETPSSEPLAEVLRGPVTSWYRLVTVILAMIAGAGSVVRILEGRWKPLAALIGLTLVVIVAIEVTQSAGQGTTPTSEVDSVAIVSVVWTVALGLLPLAVAAVTMAGAIRRGGPDEA